MNWVETTPNAVQVLPAPLLLRAIALMPAQASSRTVLPALVGA